MDQQKLEALKVKLTEQKDQLTTQLEGITNEKTFNKDKVQAKWQDIGDKDEDNALEVADFQNSISLERDLEIGLEKIEKALSKMDSGKYGICEKCGKEIEEERMMAYPEAEFCMADSSRT